MEDILSSIRRVIARDEATVQTRMSRVPTVEEVLELADRPKPKPAKDSSPAPRPETAPAHVPRAESTGAFTDAPEAPPVEFLDEPAETLVSSASAEAARQSLDALNSVFALSPSLSQSSRTIDDVVMEALRPMLKTWLDQNLPPIVEAMVAKEIRRITGQR